MEGRWKVWLACALLAAAPVRASEATLPRLPDPAPPTGSSWATRPLVNDFRVAEVGLSNAYSQSVGLVATPIGNVVLREEVRSWEDRTELAARVRLPAAFELGVTVPYLRLHEGRPTRIPFGATSAADLVGAYDREAGLADVSLRPSPAGVRSTRSWRGTTSAFR